MTVNTNISAQDALKNTVKFREFIVEADKKPFEEVLKDYPNNSEILYIMDLTQKAETYHNAISELDGRNPYIIWVVTNPKPELLKYVLFFNRTRAKNVGIFVFKASLNEDQMQFECILKPNKTSKISSGEDTENFYLDHWNRYVETCKQFDILNMIVKPIPKRSTFVSIGNANVKIMQTVSKKSGFVSSELYITDKNIYDLLFDQKDKIEKQIGELEWLRLDDKKASRIVKYFNIDVEADPERAAQEHIRSAQSLKEIYQKYIAPFYKKSSKKELDNKVIDNKADKK